ncbi:MAG: arginine--tRNA ligase [Elusimicrobiota bacterium]
MRLSILDYLRQALVTAAGQSGTGEALPLEAPPEHIRQDFDLSCPIGFALAAQNPGQKPLALAQKILNNWSALEFVEKAGVHPPAYFNVRLNAKALAEVVDQVLEEQERYPSQISWKNQNLPASVLLEFCSANPTGPLHFGHARGAILGNTLFRIWRHLGIEVQCEYYINDIGTQIERLGCSLAARYRQEILGEREISFPEDGYGGEYLSELARRLPKGLDPGNAKQFADLAKKEMLELIKKDLKELDVSFDRWYPESSLHAGGQVARILGRLKASGHVEEKEGAWWFVSKGLSDEDKERVLKRSDGRATYFAGDLAYHEDKLSRGHALALNIWGADHHGYVPRVKLGLEALGLPAKNFDAILVQMVRLVRDGAPVKLSKRAGEYLTLGEILGEVGRDALRFSLNSRSPNAQMDFDLELAKKKAMENPVFLVQYAHARICSIAREKETRGVAWPEESADQAPPLEEDRKTRALVVALALFSEALLLSAKRRSPHYLTNYLIDLAGSFHSYYETHPILSQSNSAMAFSRWRLCLAVRQVLSTALSLLGVSAPDKM